MNICDLFEQSKYFTNLSLFYAAYIKYEIWDDYNEQCSPNYLSILC